MGRHTAPIPIPPESAAAEPLPTGPVTDPHLFDRPQPPATVAAPLPSWPLATTPLTTSPPATAAAPLPSWPAPVTEAAPLPSWPAPAPSPSPSRQAPDTDMAGVPRHASVPSPAPAPAPAAPELDTEGVDEAPVAVVPRSARSVLEARDTAAIELPHQRFAPGRFLPARPRWSASLPARDVVVAAASLAVLGVAVGAALLR